MSTIVTIDPEDAIEEPTTERWTGCWYQCGQRIEHGDTRIRVHQYLFHPDCFHRWAKSS